MPAGVSPRQDPRGSGTEAMSPVVGTLLMVAITMAFAATVWLAVGGTGNKTEDAPMVSFRLDQVNGRVTVIRVEPGVDWAVHLDLQGSCAPFANLNGALAPHEPGTPVRPGDILDGCGQGQDLRIVATKPNQMIFEATF